MPPLRFPWTRRNLNDTAVSVVLVSVAIALNLALWFGAWVLMQHSETITPLHYTIYFGIDLTTARHWAMSIPGLGALIILSHLIFSRLVDHPMWRRSWFILSVALQVLLGATLLVLLFVRQV